MVCVICRTVQLFKKGVLIPKGADLQNYNYSILLAIVWLVVESHLFEYFVVLLITNMSQQTLQSLHLKHSSTSACIQSMTSTQHMHLANVNISHM